MQKAVADPWDTTCGVYGLWPTTTGGERPRKRRLLQRPPSARPIRHGRFIVKYVLFYEAAEDFRAKAPLHFPAHRARFLAFHAKGTLLMVGPLTDAEGGAMGIFTTREAALDFADGDPFVLGGVVRRWYIREWNEVLAQP